MKKKWNDLAILILTAEHILEKKPHSSLKRETKKIELKILKVDAKVCLKINLHT